MMVDGIITKEEIQDLNRLFWLFDHSIRYAIFNTMYKNEKALSKEEILEDIGYKISGNKFSEAISGFREFGLVESEKVGRKKYHRINKERYSELVRYKDFLLNEDNVL